MPPGKKFGGKDWVPGQSGNPKGREPIPPEIKQARRLSRIRFEEILQKYLHSTLEEMKAAIADPKTDAIELIVLRIMIEGIKKGDEKRLGFLLDRLLGPVKQLVSHETDGQAGFVLHVKDWADKQRK
jgi:hypothetical protein